MGVNQELGKAAEIRVATLLHNHRRSVKQMPNNHPFDLLVDGWRVNVKCSTPSLRRGTTPNWKFYVDHTGKMIEQTDFYICRLLRVPFVDDSIYLLYRAPLRKRWFRVGFKALILGHYNKQIQDFEQFTKGRFGKKDAEIAA